MSKYLIYFILFLSIGCQEKQNTLFQKTNTKDTHISFVNTVSNTDGINIITFRNFYNGGGVSIGDINNDGLNDIYFTSNMEANKLYLNEGSFKFRDISESSETAGSDSWTNGTTFIDINKDGFLDIYVCHSGVLNNTLGKNELFINQGDNTFVEMAEKYGLADIGYSIQAAFLDFDLDGDLDCYLLNNSLENPDRLNLYSDTRTSVDSLGGDRFYENQNGKFVNVTKKVGIFSSKIGFGLGVNVGYLNEDPYPDIYVSNDFWERDYLYLNNGDGTFSESLTDKISSLSLNSMGGDIGDINNDGHFDIVNTDMLPANNDRIKRMTAFDTPQAYNNKYRQGYHHQLLQNSLQLNNGNADFQEIANMAGLPATDWSWGALVFDFDLDGWQDIFVSNGIFQDLTDFDFVTFIEDKQNIAQIAEGKSSFDLNDIIALMPSSPLSNYGFVNQGDLSFEDRNESLGLEELSFSNGSAYGDLDNDGDLDLVINNLNSEAAVYKNNAIELEQNNYLKITRKRGDGEVIGMAVQLFAKGQSQKQQIFSTKGFQSSTPLEMIFGLGKNTLIDSLLISWPDGSQETLKGPINANQTLSLSKSPDFKDNNSGLRFQKGFEELPDSGFKENNYSDFNSSPLNFHDFSAKGPKIVTGDVDGDGLEDFIVLAPHDAANTLYIQNENGNFTKRKVQSFELDKGFEATAAALFDSDNDGDLDLLIGHGGNEFRRGQENFKPRFYENNGNGNFTFMVSKTPQAIGNFSTIAVEDFDKDGDLDIFLGASIVPGNYGLIPASFLFANNGDGTWQNLTNETFGTLGMVSDAVWSDYNNDGFKDLIVVGEFMPVTIIVNEINLLQSKIEVPNSEGLWQCILNVDLDKDGKEDYIVGNWGLNSKLMASSEKPLSLYVADFGDNKKEALLVNYNREDEHPYPFYGKMVLQQRFPFLKQKTLKFADYAQSSLTDLFGESVVGNSKVYSVQTLASSVLWNKEKFSLEALPHSFQISSTNSIVVDDKEQLWFFGNEYGVTPEIGRMSAHRGIKSSYTSNGLFTHELCDIKGQVRDAKLIRNYNNGQAILLARTNQPVAYLNK